VPSLSGDFQDDLKDRRARMMQRLGPDSMLIVFSAPVKVYSNDVHYEFRQDSNLYYLTGIDQPDTTLVLMPGNRDHRKYCSSNHPIRSGSTGRDIS
jgi:Xaa-Pro aminopeptidase